jgi:hypothetical protein
VSTITTSKYGEGAYLAYLSTFMSDPVGVEKPMVPAPAGDFFAYPNPGAGGLVHINRSGAGPVRIFDLEGRLVKTVLGAPAECVWNGMDDAGRPVAGGVYFLRTPGKKAVRFYLPR